MSLLIIEADGIGEQDDLIGIGECLPAFPIGDVDGGESESIGEARPRKAQCPTTLSESPGQLSSTGSHNRRVHERTPRSVVGLATIRCR